MFLFTCGEKKICSSTKMPQNIMNIVVELLENAFPKNFKKCTYITLRKEKKILVSGTAVS